MIGEEINIASFDDFFRWCENNGLQRSRDIAKVFRRTPQTIDNWRSGRSRNRVFPKHLRLSCIGYMVNRRENGLIIPTDSPITPTMFELWQKYHGLETLESVAKTFGLTRQAVHNWQVRNKYPNWLNLACDGYSHVQAEAKKNSIHEKKSGSGLTMNKTKEDNSEHVDD
jgi:DNA-binding transcriptional regulator YiaG